jgi:HD-GYP domain-containing protein (c-di-GMP phosphodiesterase class II)
MNSEMKLLFIKNTLCFQAIGVLFYIAISFTHDGINIHRSLGSYLLPGLVGGTVGTIIGLMKSIIQQKNRQERQSFFDIIEVLANSLDERDKYTHGHSRRVTNLSLALGNKIALKQSELELLRLGSILHDIGKIGVPDHILLKPGKLSHAEYDIIKKHPGKGERILCPMKQDHKKSQLIAIVKYHHERFDGKGYPEGSTGEDIPLMARIVSIADSYDAMTSDRPYRKGMDKGAALQEIKNGSGTQYDPHLSSVFIAMMKQYGEADCPSQATCTLFQRIENNEVSAAYKAQFCHGLHKSCSRYKFKIQKNVENSMISDGLMPDGSFLQI